MKNLSDISDAIDNAERFGMNDDNPEGVRYIKISDTLAKEISDILRRYERA